MDAAGGGSIMNKTVEEAHQLFEELASNNYQDCLKRLLVGEQLVCWRLIDCQPFKLKKGRLWVKWQSYKPKP